MLRNKVIFALVLVGILVGLCSAYVYAVPNKPLPPVFNPAPNPYAQGIYANGIVESSQTNGENVNIYPEVAGTITQHPGRRGPERDAGHAAPHHRRHRAARHGRAADGRRPRPRRRCSRSSSAQPRKENLEVARAQVDMATASLKSAEDQMAKQQRSFELAPESVSRDALDNAVNAYKVAKANLDVVTRQYELTKAGAWVYDIKNQERQHEALVQGPRRLERAARQVHHQGARRRRGPLGAGGGGQLRLAAGRLRHLHPGLRSRSSSWATPTAHLDVRCYVDEILIPRLPPAAQDARADVHPRHRHQDPARVRARAALRLAQDPALQPAAGEGRPARAAGHLPLRSAARRRRLSRASWSTSTSGRTSRREPCHDAHP